MINARLAGRPKLDVFDYPAAKFNLRGPTNTKAAPQRNARASRSVRARIAGIQTCPAGANQTYGLKTTRNAKSRGIEYMASSAISLQVGNRHDLTGPERDATIVRKKTN